MNDDWWLKIGEKVLEYLPAIGGAFVSLRYLDEKMKFRYILTSFIASIFAGIYMGEAIVAHYSKVNPVDPSIRNFVLFASGAFGLLIIAKANKLILQISYKDMIEVVKTQLRKWVG